MKTNDSRTRWTALFAIPALAVMLAFTGCKKPPPPVVVKAPLHAPANLTDNDGWKKYYQDVIQHNANGVEGTISPYYLPAPGGKDYDDMYGRQEQGVADIVSRGVLPGNMMAFMSPDSTKMADLVVEAFKKASPGSMKKVFVLFVGKPEDNDRVKAAVEPSGVTYRFVGFD